MCLDVNRKQTLEFQRKRKPIEVLKSLYKISGGRFQSPFVGFVWDFRKWRAYYAHNPLNNLSAANLKQIRSGAFHFYFPDYNRDPDMAKRTLWVLPRDVVGVGTFCGDRSIAATVCYSTRNGALRAMKRK